MSRKKKDLNNHEIKSNECLDAKSFLSSPRTPSTHPQGEDNKWAHHVFGLPPVPLTIHTSLQSAGIYCAPTECPALCLVPKIGMNGQTLPLPHGSTDQGAVRPSVNCPGLSVVLRKHRVLWEYSKTTEGENGWKGKEDFLEEAECSTLNSSEPGQGWAQ